VNAGLKVIGFINIQYVEELNQQVETITGKHVTETVPVSFIKSADEIEIVDAPPEEPIERSPEQQTRIEVRQQQLSALRELTLVLAADVVDCQLNDYLEKHGIKQSFGAQERILVCVTPRANAREMIETARIIAEKFHAEMTVAYVKQAGLSSEDQGRSKKNLPWQGRQKHTLKFWTERMPWMPYSILPILMPLLNSSSVILRVAENGPGVIRLKK